MIVPNFENDKFVDENGYLTAKWSNILQNLFSRMQAEVGQEGFVIPSLPSSDINSIEGESA